MAFLITLNIIFFTICTPFHHNPRMCDTCGLKFPVIPLSNENSCNLFVSVRESLDACSGNPLLFINLRRLSMKLSMSRPSKIIKWKARVLQQVKNTPKHFSLDCRCFTVIAPNKSIPIYQRRDFIASTLVGFRSLIFYSLYIFFFSS